MSTEHEHDWQPWALEQFAREWIVDEPMPANLDRLRVCTICGAMTLTEA